MEYDFTVDGGGHVSRTNTLLMHRYAQKVIFRSHLCGEAQDSGRTQTRFFAQERNERSWTASFRSTRFDKVEQ